MDVVIGQQSIIARAPELINKRSQSSRFASTPPSFLIRQNLLLFGLLHSLLSPISLPCLRVDATALFHNRSYLIGVTQIIPSSNRSTKLFDLKEEPCDSCWYDLFLRPCDSCWSDLFFVLETLPFLLIWFILCSRGLAILVGRLVKLHFWEIVFIILIIFVLFLNSAIFIPLLQSQFDVCCTKQ